MEHAGYFPQLFEEQSTAVPYENEKQDSHAHFEHDSDDKTKGKPFATFFTDCILVVMARQNPSKSLITPFPLDIKYIYQD